MPSMLAVHAMGSPVAGPVGESALNTGGYKASRADTHARGGEAPAAITPPPRPPKAAAYRPSNETNSATSPTVSPALAPAESSDTGTFGLDAEAEGPAQSRALRKWATRLPFAAVFAGMHGRSTHDGSLQRRGSKVSWRSWETARQQDSGGPRWTRALMFPSTVEGFLARVRWQAFQQDVTQLAEQMMRLHQTAKNVLLHLPGPQGLADPTVVPDGDAW